MSGREKSGGGGGGFFFFFFFDLMSNKCWSSFWDFRGPIVGMIRLRATYRSVLKEERKQK